MFFQIDDQFHVNQKAKTLARKALMNDVRGLAALGLWTMAGSMCQAALNDGVSTVEDLVSITLNHGVAVELADLLVSAELWHTTGHTCERCPAVKPGTYLYHDWFAMGYDTAAQVKTTRGKRKELKDPAIIAAVWARDCIDDPANPAVGLCRYCQREIKRADRKSEFRGEMDHVVPNLYCGTRNIVLACLACNRKKGARTPEQAGMTLHPAPRSQESAGASENVSPASAAAEMSQAPETAAEAPIRTDIKSDSLEEPELISDEKAIPVGARTGMRPGRAGQGRVTEGLRDGVTAPESSRSPRNRRRRGKGKPQPAAASRQQGTASPASTSRHDAGPTPAVNPPGRYGSPWHGWSGKPSTVTETTCAEHNEEQPCRKCQEDSGK